MIQLETYKGTKSRHTCPNCNNRGVFVRYQTENGEYLSYDVGRCNRESKCGYHKKPKEFFADNPNGAKFRPAAKRKTNPYQYTEGASIDAPIKTKSFDYIPLEKFKLTLGNYCFVILILMDNDGSTSVWHQRSSFSILFLLLPRQLACFGV